MNRWIVGFAALIVVSSLVVAPFPVAGSVVVDFESVGLTEGTLLTNQLQGSFGVVFSNTLVAVESSPSYGFNSGGTGAEDLAKNSEGAPFATRGNVFISDLFGGDSGGKPWFGGDPGTNIIVDFDNEVYNLQFLVADINGSDADPEILTATVYDGTNTLLETVTLSNGAAGDGMVDSVVFTKSGIRRLEIDVTKGNDVVGFGVDNIQFEVVPEPASLVIWSLLAAIGAIVGCWRRRKR